MPGTVHKVKHREDQQPATILRKISSNNFSAQVLSKRWKRSRLGWKLNFLIQSIGGGAKKWQKTLNFEGVKTHDKKTDDFGLHPYTFKKNEVQFGRSINVAVGILEMPERSM